MADKNSTPILPPGVKDLTGQIFGSWTVLRFARLYRAAFWICRCECGIVKELRRDYVQKALKCFHPKPNRTEQICIKCGENKAITEFKIVVGKYRCKTCKPCLAKERHAYQVETKDHIKAYRETNKERINRKKRENWARNKERNTQKQRGRYVQQREYLIERTNQWVRDNPEKARANKALHEARKKGAEGKYTAVDVQKMLLSQRGTCTYCRRDISDCYTVDHVIPLSRGGSNWPDNLQLVCASCNSSKNTKTHEEYLELLSKSYS